MRSQFRNARVCHRRSALLASFGLPRHAASSLQHSPGAVSRNGVPYSNCRACRPCQKAVKLPQTAIIRSLVSLHAQYSVKILFLYRAVSFEVRSRRADVGASAMDSGELRQQATRCRRLAYEIGRIDVSYTLYELANAIEEDECNANRQDVIARC
jgi:hypothetical protein